MNNNYSIIVAAGASTRMNSQIPKPYIKVNNKPLLYYSLNAFINVMPACNIVVVINNNHKKFYNDFIHEFNEFIDLTYVTGGEQRFDSVKNALSILPDNGFVAIHDAARPFLPISLINNGFALVKEYDSAIPYHQVPNSVRLKQNNNTIPLPRKNVMIIDTPQFFNISLLKIAYEQNLILILLTMLVFGKNLIYHFISFKALT